MARGSKSFRLAARLLPAEIRHAAMVFYAFCRVADDAVDDAPDAAAAQKALRGLEQRLDGVFAGVPERGAVDRALAVVVREHRLSRVPFDALLEGFRWDVEGRSYRTLSELYGYAARVAGTVGVVMTLLMGRRGPATLARACDLGVAMQLTNIARDVGADAKMGRVYLPLDWLKEAGMTADAFLVDPRPSPAIRAMTERLLVDAEALYRRAAEGIADLPFGCRFAIHAASLIYEGLHREIRRAGLDSVTRRARVGTARKLALVLVAAARALRARSAEAPAPPLTEVRFLVQSEGVP